MASIMAAIAMLASSVAPALAIHDVPRISIERHQAVGSPFDPRTQRVQIWYHLPQRVDQATVQILRGGNVVKTLFQGEQSSGTHYVTWEDGRYDNGNLPFWGAHTYCITAELREDRVRECGALNVEYLGDNPFGLDAQPEVQPAEPRQPAQPAEPQQPAQPPKPAQPQPSGSIVSVTPANREINFGNVQVGTTKSENITLRNLGSAQLYFYVLNTPGSGAFQSSTFSRDTFSEATFIAPGESYTFSVSFTPTLTGFQEANFALRTNDASRRNITFDMFGWGTRVTTPTSTPQMPQQPTPTAPPTVITFDLQDFGPSRKEFNPEMQETVMFSYGINKEAFVTFIVDGRVMTNNQKQSAGNHNVNWNGRDASGAIVPEGTYTYAIAAYTATGEIDQVNGTIRVSRLVAGKLIEDFTARPTIFNPLRDQVEFNFYLNSDSYVELWIVERENTNRLVKTIAQNKFLEKGRNRLFWDGRDAGGLTVPEGTYRYEFLANAAEGRSVSNKRFGNLEVDYDNLTNDGRACAGFVDVHAADPICNAVRFVKERGIFLGDDISNRHPGKTIRLGDPLNRAETAAVLLRTMEIPLLPYNHAMDGNLGFRDLDTTQWYMSPLKTAIKTAVYYRPDFYGYGTPTIPIMAGYPDGSMKPFRGAKRGEIYKIFIESALTSPTVRANFSLNRFVTHSVFADTPATQDRQWYLPYADWMVRYFNNTDFARRYFGSFDLFNNRTARFQAGEIPTRGEIIELIYESHSKNLIDFK